MPGKSRRTFLLGSLAVGANLVLESQGRGLISLLARKALCEDKPAGISRDGGLVRIPGRGNLFVASDFHGRHSDFKKWLKTTELEKRLKNDEDVFALILGDVVDRKANDPQADRNGDTRIVDKIMEMKTSLGKSGERIVYILGNHEWEVIRICEKFIAGEGWDPDARSRIVEKIYSRENGAFYKQFNFIERIDEKKYEFLRELPLAVVTENGFVGVHGGPGRSKRSRKDIVEKQEKVVEEIVWGRPEAVRTGGYILGDVDRFLLLLWNSSVLLCGHTPLNCLPKSWIKNGVGLNGNHQVILATSYGSTGGEKSHLVLPLDKSYDGVSGLSLGKEIRRLFK